MRPTRHLVAAILLVAAGAPADAEPASAAKAEAFMTDVDAWLARERAKDLVVHANGKILACDPSNGSTRVLGKEAGPIRQLYQIDDDTIGYEVHGENFTILNTATGKATVCASGPGNYEPGGLRPGRRWFIVMAIRTQPEINFEFHRVDLDTHAVKRVYETRDPNGVEKFSVSDDGKSLVVLTESDKVETCIQRTVDLESLQVKVEKVSREKPMSYPLPDGSGRIVQDKGSLWVERGGERKDLFPGLGSASAFPDDAERPRRLAVSRLVDSNGDGKLVREAGSDDDQIEIWMLDLVTLQKTLLADAKLENIGRDWTGDGSFYVYQRLRPSGPSRSDVMGDLYAYDPAAKRHHVVRPPDGFDYVLYTGDAGPGRLLIAYEKMIGRERWNPFRAANEKVGREQADETRSVVLDLGDADRTLLEVRGDVHRSTWVGGVLVWAVLDPEKGTQTLYRVTLPPR